MSLPILYSVAFDATADRIFEVLTVSAQFAAMTGLPAEIGTGPGAAFVCFGGMIEGRHLELIPNERIVQSWRIKTWAPGVYSIVRFELKPEAGGTRLEFEHVGFPLEHRAHLEPGWRIKYWEPLAKHLSAK